MYVNAATFAKMLGNSIERTLMSAQVRIPSLNDLLALKLHAARYAPWRMLKDMADIVYLIDANQIDVKSDQFRQLCLRFGTEQIYEQLRGKG
jgi:predicted nucleotidyltransferase